MLPTDVAATVTKVISDTNQKGIRQYTVTSQDGATVVLPEDGVPRQCLSAY